MDLAALARRWWHEAWGEADFDVVDELIADDYVRHAPGGTVRRDRHGVKCDIQQYQRVLHKPDVSIDDQAVHDDRVWTRVTCTGVNPETGDRRTVTFMQIQRFAGGKIVESWLMYHDVDWR